MPGFATQATAKEDSGYASSPTPTFSDDRPELEEQLNKLSITSTDAASDTRPSPSSISHTEWSFSQVNHAGSASHHISVTFPTSLSTFSSSDNSHPSTSSSFFSSPPILLQVGGPHSPSQETEPVLFFVHDALLTRASGFFRSALRKTSSFEGSTTTSYGFLEAQTRTIKLSEDRPDDVRLFLKWLYHGFGAGIFPPTTTTTTPAATKPEEKKETSTSSPSCSSSSCPLSALSDSSLSTLSSILLPPRTTRLLSRHRTYRAQRREYNTALQSLTAKGYTNTEDLLGPPPSRPAPPSFSPLVRLYVLADKYAIGLGLKDLVVDLVRELAGTCNAVPRKEDVNLLWSATGTRYDEGLKKLVLDLYGGMKTTNMLCEDGEDEGVFWDELFLIGLVERMRVAYEQEKGRKEGGGDGKGFGKGNEYVKMGRLVGRRRCDYHDHEW